MYSHEYIALELHRLRVRDFERKANTHNRVIHHNAVEEAEEKKGGKLFFRRQRNRT